MIEKSPATKMYEESDALIEGFRDSVRQAQSSARKAGVPAVFVINGMRYLAMPDGTITSNETTKNETTNPA